MCSILGYLGGAIPRPAFTAALAKTASRGPDDTRVDALPGGWLGFNRLSIMGPDARGMQPFHLGGDALVCNGEIYGFRPVREALRHKYVFSSDSDCEVLLPLWREHGVGMFSMLDAEFALILYDARRGSLVAARDPIGIRPLYYGCGADGAILFASEPKMLVGLCARILPFPPGCYYADGEFTRYCDIAAPCGRIGGSTDDVCAAIREKLVSGVEKRLDADAPLGFLLSGGLDSSLVCAIAQRKLGRPIRTFAIGMDADPIDLKYARETADFLGCEHTEVTMTKADVLEALPAVVAALGTYDITTVRASIGMYLVCKYIHEHTDVRVLLTGEVSDELFGYKYTDFAPSADEFQREAEKRVRELHMYDVLRADRCISVHSLEARVPFGDLDFVRYVMALEPSLKMNTYGKGKYLLRKAFEAGGFLPENILWREKAAFSDAVGHSMVDHLKAYADARYTDAEFERRASRYAYARPFTKESLLYRELFEQGYPGQAAMVAGFWMPNRSWAGCDVDDPSARVLSNYKESGI
ncbi:MAG: asparagine synthase B [Oscillospiraceae bacterium]|nr:asparagine synthase B [Oscillospiraceae bacterium]